MLLFQMNRLPVCHINNMYTAYNTNLKPIIMEIKNI